MPTNKVTAGVLAGALTGLILWGVKQWGKVDVPIEAASSLSVILTFATQWMVTDSEKAA